jgi:hypothetical protein
VRQSGAAQVVGLHVFGNGQAGQKVRRKLRNVRRLQIKNTNYARRVLSGIAERTRRAFFYAIAYAFLKKNLDIFMRE